MYIEDEYTELKIELTKDIKKEIYKLKQKINQEGYTLIPLKLYFKDGRAKILIGVAKGKKNYDKRETIKQRDIDKYNKKTMKY